MKRCIRSNLLQTSYLSRGLKDRAVLDIEDLFDIKVPNETALNHMMDVAQLAIKNITEAISGIDAAIYFINPSQSDELLQKFIDRFEFYELLRWPITLGFLTFLLFLCTVLVIGVARSSRCLLIFFAVLGLFTVAICWLLSGVYLATSVAAADFCVSPYQHFCNQQRLQYIYQSNCGATGTNHFVIRLGSSRENLELAKRSLYQLEDIGKRILPSHNVPSRIAHLYPIIDHGANALSSKTLFTPNEIIQFKYCPPFLSLS
jgi:protein tweety